MVRIRVFTVKSFQLFCIFENFHNNMMEKKRRGLLQDKNEYRKINPVQCGFGLDPHSIKAKKPHFLDNWGNSNPGWVLEDVKELVLFLLLVITALWSCCLKVLSAGDVY